MVQRKETGSGMVGRNRRKETGTRVQAPVKEFGADGDGRRVDLKGSVYEEDE